MTKFNSSIHSYPLFIDSDILPFVKLILWNKLLFLLMHSIAFNDHPPPSVLYWNLLTEIQFARFNTNCVTETYFSFLCPPPPPPE